MYNDFVGTMESPSEEYERVIEERSKLFVNPELGAEYDTVRFGMPHGVVCFNEYKDDRKCLISHFINHGYKDWPYTKIKPRFRKHVALFRAALDFWEQFSKAKVMQKDEIYYRCLTEGHSFTERIKKMRSTCYRAFTSETDTDIEEEYYSSEYDGYNSIIHERYLIHWDDTKDVDDVKYAFVEAGEDRTESFNILLDRFWEEFRLDELEFSSEFDMIGSLKNTKMYDPLQKKTMLMREFWGKDIDPRSPYFAKRVVVPTTPGSTRDTGIGDPSTILKVKQLNELARVISERIPYSANADGKVSNERLKRVLKRDMFLHLDFKKFGLTFPRYLMNCLIRKIQSSSGLDLNHLIIDDFYVEIDGSTYKTKRGTMLGWLDAINSICVSVILHFASKKMKFDFITFNDDVEISKRGREYPQTLELLRAGILSTINFYDIPISINKTFGSRASVFLERYSFYDRYGIDMYKEQLTVNAYSKSCVSTEIWRAKFLFATAEQWTKSAYATDRCIDTCDIEFRKDEVTLPIWSGGWFIRRKNGLDLSLEESDKLGRRLGYELQKHKAQRYATRPEKASSNSAIYAKINNNAYNASSGDLWLLENSKEVETLIEINDEVDYIYHAIETKVDMYFGKDESYPLAILDIVQKQCRGWDPFIEE